MNIIVTGASRGIGYQTALEFALEGNHNILAISRNLSALEKLKKEIDNTVNTQINILDFDLAQKDYSKLLEKIVTVFKLKNGNKIDVLINNAGFLVNKPFIELIEDDWQNTFETNLFTPVRLIKELYRYFNRTEGTHIINIGSMGGVQGTEKFPGLSAYSASKGALNILTEALAKEFEGENIRVNCINPGAVQTEMLEQAFPGFKADVSAKDMAKYIVNFALTAHKLMNGQLNQVSLRG